MNSSAFYNALVKRPSDRTDEDVTTVFNHLRRLDVFERLHDAPLRSVCRTARLERHPANYVLFRKGQLATCWYILLSGSVFMNKQVYLPIGCFGKRSNMNLRRMSDCIVISPSDMIVIDYPDVQRITVHLNNQQQQHSATSTDSMASSSSTAIHQQNGQGTSATTAFPSAASQHSVNSLPPSATTNSAAGNRQLPRVAADRRPIAAAGTAGTNPRTSGGGPAPAQQQRFPAYSPGHKNQQPQQQQQFLFHRFPAPPPPSSHPAHQQQPHHNNNNQHLRKPQHQQSAVPIATASISHRVPSPAPTATHTSPIKQHQKPSSNANHQYPSSMSSAMNNNSRTLGTSAHQHHHQHSKSNSLSETQQQPKVPGASLLHSHEVEVPFVRAKVAPSNGNGRVLKQMAAETVEEHFSPPRPPRSTPFARAMSGATTTSVIQQRKGIFESAAATATTASDRHNVAAAEASSASSDQQHQMSDETETGTMKRRGNGNDPSNSSSTTTKGGTLTHQQQSGAVENGQCAKANSRDEEKEETLPHQHPPPSSSSSSNFQRLSKVRLNIGGSGSSSRKNSQQQQQPIANGISSHGPSAQLTTAAMANVRIRQQSPHRQPPMMANGQPASMLATGRIRRSTASNTSALTGDESDCFAGLPETAVDSEGPEGDEEDDEEEEDEEGSCPSHDSFQELRDSVRECLEKEPSQRSAEDVAVLIEFMASLPALAPLPMGIKRQLCEKMVFAVVPSKGTAIMQHGERIDAWSVVVNGCVEQVHSNGQRVEYRVGDCFGVRPTAQAQYNDGEIRTLADDCEFVLVEHGDFHAIMCTLSRHIERENGDSSGEVVREVERRLVDNQVELVITKASADRLLRQLLVEDNEDGNGNNNADETFVAGVDGTGPTATSSSVQMDSHFVEDFLLMHRVFFPDSTLVVRQLIDWFRTEPAHRDRVARIMLLWLNNHFEDFEGGSSDSDGKMTALLNEFDELLGETKMFNHQSLLSITCSVKSQPRQITLTRSDRKEPLDFQLVGGCQEGIFVHSINADSAAHRQGLKRGDEILEVNGQNFRKLSLVRAEELFRESTHLSISLKTNWIGFRESLCQQDDQVDSCPVFRPAVSTATLGPASSGGGGAVPSRYQKKCSAPMMAGHGQQHNQRERRSTLSAALNQNELQPHHYQQHQQFKAGSATPTGSVGGPVSSKKVLNKLLHMIRGSAGPVQPVMEHQHNNNHIAQQQHQQQMTDSADEMALPQMALGVAGGGGTLRASRSNPDISAHALGSCSSAASSSSQQQRHSSLCPGQPDQVLKVYRSDQTFRYVPICTDTSAKQLVHQALQEFGIISSSSAADGAAVDCCWWALYECSVSREGVTKQRRLPDSANNLGERVGLNARLYLRDLQKDDTNLLPDEVVPEVLKQARLTLYTLNAQCIATQLTLQDFAVFASIEPTEYVNHLFRLGEDVDENPCVAGHGKRKVPWPRLAEFEALFNREMWWVATEVCCERNIYRRSKLIKKFIKIARHCHMLRNLNSMFAIVSALEKPAVRRLAHTWERVPGKYLKMLTDLQQLMDPSRNMSRYRQHLAQLALEPPLIPIYPVLRKDLTFAHEANPTLCGPRLVNFEKLRMIAHMVRGIQRFSSVHYDAAELLAGTVAGTGTLSYQSPELLLLEPGTTIRKGGAAAASVMAGIVAGTRFGTSSGTSAGGLSRKKLYERTLMLRRVKTYLQAMPVIDSELDLDRISLECEPPALATGYQSSSIQQLHHHHNNHSSQQQHQQANSASTSTTRRRLPSPSPSSLSSSSSIQQQELRHRHQQQQAGAIGMPKFGVESPQAVQKMLSLVQNSKICKTRNAFHLPSSSNHRMLHQSHGTLSTAELPPIASDQRKRSSVTSSNSTAEDNNERAI